MKLACELDLGNGELYRLGGDEADPGDVVTDVDWSTSNPGGHSDASFTIARPEWATREALLFADARIYDADTGPAGRKPCRLERAAAPETRVCV